jgi:hypothetical protein
MEGHVNDEWTYCCGLQNGSTFFGKRCAKEQYQKLMKPILLVRSRKSSRLQAITKSTVFQATAIKVNAGYDLALFRSSLPPRVLYCTTFNMP